MQRLEKTPLVSRQSGIVIIVYYHRAGKKTFARVYINLELSVNEKFVACGTKIKILEILKSRCTKECYLIQKLESAIRRVYLFFLPIICLAEGTL